MFPADESPGLSHGCLPCATALRILCAERGRARRSPRGHSGPRRRVAPQSSPTLRHPLADVEQRDHEDTGLAARGMELAAQPLGIVVLRRGGDDRDVEALAGWRRDGIHRFVSEPSAKVDDELAGEELR